MCWQMGRYVGQRKPQKPSPAIILDTPAGAKKRLLNYKKEQIKSIRFLMTNVILKDTAHGRK